MKIESTFKTAKTGIIYLFVVEIDSYGNVIYNASIYQATITVPSEGSYSHTIQHSFTHEAKYKFVMVFVDADGLAWGVDSEVKATEDGGEESSSVTFSPGFEFFFLTLAVAAMAIIRRRK